MIEKTVANQPIINDIFTADPSAHVFNGKIYIYPSHDLAHECVDNDNGDQYVMEDYHVLSMDHIGAECVDNGEALNMRDVPWVSQQMWAPDCIKRDGKYYLYFPARDKDGVFRIGVAVSESPVGPFKPEDDYIEGSYSIDPCVLDEGDRAYMYFGGLWGGQLEMWQNGFFEENAHRPEGDETALGPMYAELATDLKHFVNPPKSIQIFDENGIPLRASDEKRRYFEGPWVHKYNGLYYLSYSTGTTCTIVYAVSNKPDGPYVYKGKILEPVLGWTTHHSILEIDGKWYIFYHDCSLSGGVNHKRCVKFSELHYDSDGMICTINPYDN